jgi:hypothetical protein
MTNDQNSDLNATNQVISADTRGARPLIAQPESEGKDSEVVVLRKSVPLRALPAPQRQGATGISDFINGYVKYADVIEAPPEAHEAVAIRLLASVLNPRVHIENGALRIPLDLWLLLLSSSGLGRNTLVNLMGPILDAAGLNGVLLNTTWGSKQAFYQRTAEHPTGLLVWPEMAAVLKNLADSRFAGVKEWLTDRYDNWTIPEEIRYRDTGSASDTPTISFKSAPRLNILATSSFDWFINNLAQEDTTGGFVPRWILAKLRSTTKLVPIPKNTDGEMIKPLAEHLHRASELKGVADISAVASEYDCWYRETYRRFSGQPNRALAIPFFNRLRTHVLKLALVYEVSQSLTLRVSAASMQRAIEAARNAEQTIFFLLPTGLSREGAEVDKIARQIQATGPQGLRRSELTHGFQHVRASDRESRLHTLVEGGDVHRFRRTTAGRSAEVLIHRDHVGEHTKLFPEDREW